MANPAHERLLRSGISGWNDWRFRNGSVTPDLTGLRMPAANLAGCDLHHARLDGAKLIRANLQGADLRYANLRRAELYEVDLSDADLYRANLDGAILAGAKLRRARLYGATLCEARVTVADLRKADLREARLQGADLRESLGTGASFEKADFTRTELALCQLGGSNLLGTAGLTSRQLEEAILDGSTLVPRRLGGAGAPSQPIEALVDSLRGTLARATGNSVPDSVVHSYHAALEKLRDYGVGVDDVRIQPEELVRPLDFGARTPGGEAFEPAPVEWVDASLFRERVSRLLERLRTEAHAAPPAVE